MKQNISVTRARTHRLKIRLTGPDGLPYVMSMGEKLIFGVKKELIDDNYIILKIIGYQAGFSKITDTSAPTWKEDEYYSKTTLDGVDTYTLTTSEPSNWNTTYSNYYVNNGLYSVDLNPSDTEPLYPNSTYFYDVGLQSGDNYYSVIDTSKLYLEGNVTKKEAQQHE